jgi:PilZ domain-containing protein
MLRRQRAERSDRECAPLEPLLPGAGDEVRLLLGETDVEARVHAAPPGRLELELHAAPLNLRRASGLAAQVHSCSETGVARLLGRLCMLSGHAAGGVLVEFTYAGTPQLLLRREHVRADLEAPIELYLPGGVVHTQTVNMSAGGLLVRGPVDARIGDRIEVAFRLPGARSGVRGVATVVHVTPSGDVGVALLDVSAADRARLTLAVFEERRRAASAARA